MPKSKLTPEVRLKAVEAYAKSGILTVAAKEAGVCRTTLWAEARRNKAFKRQLEQAKGVYTDYLEGILNERIADGKDKMSGVLLMFKLKAEMPDKYRERVDHKVEGNIKIISGVPRPNDKKESG